MTAITITIGNKMFGAKINGRAGTVVISSDDNGLCEEDYSAISKIVPTNGAGGVDLKGRLGQMDCTYRNCRIVYSGDEGFEIMFDGIMQDFKI